MIHRLHRPSKSVTELSLWSTSPLWSLSSPSWTQSYPGRVANKDSHQYQHSVTLQPDITRQTTPSLKQHRASPTLSKHEAKSASFQTICFLIDNSNVWPDPKLWAPCCTLLYLDSLATDHLFHPKSRHHTDHMPQHLVRPSWDQQYLCAKRFRSQPCFQNQATECHSAYVSMIFIDFPCHRMLKL